MTSNLPPGCTQDDIDRAFGGVSKCCECGMTKAASADADEDKSWTCPKCAKAIARQDYEDERL